MGLDALPSILETTQKVAFPENINFQDPETPIEDIVDRLCHAASYFNNIAITDFGGKTGGVRERGLVEQIVGAPFQTFGGVDMYPDPFEKAGRLFRGIVQGHPFNDANKRTGFLTASYYLAKMGYSFPEHLPLSEVYDFCLQVSSGEVREVGDIIEKIRYFWQKKEEPSHKINTYAGKENPSQKEDFIPHSSDVDESSFAH